MTTFTILVATWSDGVLAVTNSSRKHELQGQSMRGMASDGAGSALAVVDDHTLRRRSTDGAWRTIGTSESDLSCTVATSGEIYAGTDDAAVLRLHANGTLEPLPGFAHVPGRETWYAGTALIDGKVVGPPLGIRSITATCDGAILANVHVGGIPRSADGGATWQPTINVNEDVHEVRAHDTRPDIVIAAAATGLCVSRDGGQTWSVEQAGLHATHCSAVAFVGADVFVSAAEDPFSAQGGVYRRPLDGPGPLLPVGGGLPRWFDRGVDTTCIAARGPIAALADRGGNLYLSEDAGRTWSRIAHGLPMPSGLLIL